MNFDKNTCNLDQAVHISYTGFQESGYKIVQKQVLNFWIFEKVIPAHVEFEYFDGTTSDEGSIREWQRRKKDQYAIVHGVILKKPSITIKFSDRSEQRFFYSRVDECEKQYLQIVSRLPRTITY